jgi:SAM-dependent methyltransferase
MQEYFGLSAQKYGQPSDKFYTLFPALERMVPRAQPGQTLIDFGCGTGDLYDFVTELEYIYTGFDISADMLAQAKNKHPDGEFIQGDATQLTSVLDKRFDIVLSNMLFPSMDTKANFLAAFQSIEKLLATEGSAVISTGHPCFDGYMQKHFFAREDINADFQGYHCEGKRYQVFKSMANGEFTFNDYHWRLTDYFTGAKQVGLFIDEIDECPMMGEPPADVRQKLTERGVPTYLIMRLKRLNPC